VTARRRAVLAALACALVMAACRDGQAPRNAPPDSAAGAVPPVPLPDISNASAIVQEQLREQHAKMTAAVSQTSLPAAERANAYGEMGKLFIAADHYRAAERCFLHARALAPDDMRWPYFLAHVARLSNETAKAAALFEQALALQPSHVPSLVWLAEMYLAEGQAARAKPLLLKARSIDPGEAAVSSVLGRVALEERDYAGAVKELETGLAAVPSATRLQYPLAMAYRGLGDTAKAEAHLKLRGETDLPPADALMGEVGGLLKNATIFETRGTQAIDARNWPEAVRELRQALAVAPNNGFTRLNLGTALYMTGDAAGALEQYQAAVRLQPNLAKAHFAMGVLMESSGRDDDAIAAFETAIRNDPGYVEARFSLANALRRRGRVRESLPHYDEVLRLSPAVSQASFGYAMGLVRLGDYARARERLERDVQAFPDQPGITHALARLLAAAPDDRVRDGARALALARALEQSQPPTLALVETIAMALAEVGRFDEAVARQRQAIEGARDAGRPDLAARLTANLRLYQQRRPCRTPWADDDPVHRPGNQ
jgi:tetratricopeptide (TPR) repeat protein